jgi:LuxR family maltose regulon positive regulatory protein
MGLAAKKAAPHKRKPLPLLTPEYLQGVHAFAHRYFEDLFTRLSPPFALVFDNYHEIPTDSLLHEVIREGLSAIPERISIIFISRTSRFCSSRGKQFDGVIGRNELRFDLVEPSLQQRQFTSPYSPDITNPCKL